MMQTLGAFPDYFYLIFINLKMIRARRGKHPKSALQCNLTLNIELANSGYLSMAPAIKIHMTLGHDTKLGTRYVYNKEGE